MPNNVEKLDQSWSQLNNKASWLFTWIASTILDTKIPVMNGTKDQKTSLRTELAWLPDNFKALHNLNARFHPGKVGKEGVSAAIPEGDLMRALRVAEFNTAATNATVQSMAGALAAVAKGEALDVDKLLAGIESLLDDQFEKKVGVELTINNPVAEPVRALVKDEDEGAK